MINESIATNTFDFKAFDPFVNDEDITDINYNGKELWLDHLKKGRYVCEDFFLDESVEQFCYRFANYANLQFNPTHPVIESETANLRLSLLHESIAKSGYSISIRKTPAKMRLKHETMISTKYTSDNVLELLERVVKAHCSVLISGSCGAGKTELAKYLTSFIPSHERVITIEDTLEIRYTSIHPHKDGVSLKVNDKFNYVDAIKACLRQRPNWIMVSEVRSSEVAQMLEALSTGAKLITTLHAEDAASIPVRLLHMFPGVEISNTMILHNIYEFIDIGIHIESSITKEGIKRYIREIIYFDLDHNSQIVQHVLYSRNKGKQISAIPPSLQIKLDRIESNEEHKKTIRKTNSKPL